MTTPDLCGSCRHWTKPEQSWEGEYGRCGRVQHISDSGDDVRTEPITVTDIEGLDANVRTLPTFGCVLFEETTP